MNPADRAAQVMAALHLQYPDAACTLNFQTPEQLLIAAILSAQCTDIRVNIITESFFRHFPDLQAIIDAPIELIEAEIRSCGLFRAKARAISATCRMLAVQYGGQVPADRPSLMKLPGVGRKIANLILGDCHGIPAIVVDTHCIRISNLIGLSDSKNPLRVEQDLIAAIPESEWIAYGHLMVTHGRDICTARHPHCDCCPIRPYCRFGGSRSDV
jgi:endonuclease-3